MRLARHTALLLGVALVAPSLLTAQTHAPMSNDVDALPDPYARVPGFVTLPEGRSWGATSAVYTAADGEHIWVAERCGANVCVNSDVDPVMLVDPDGNVVRSFGAGMFAWPHGMFVDDDGNVWVTDATGYAPVPEGWGHVIYKFSPEGELLMTLGQRGVFGDGEDEFIKPSDILVAPDGSMFVADGHAGGRGQPANNRIVKLDSEGNFLMAWGQKGSADGEFDDPHALAMDSQGRLFVGDRANSRIQIFDQEGNHLETWTHFGRPSGLFITEDDVLYATDSESNTGRNPGVKRGIYIGNALTGELTAFIRDPEPDPDNSGTSGAEGVAVDKHGNVYGAEVGPRTLRKYVPEDAVRGAMNGAEWRYWGGDAYSTRYSSLDQINADNFEDLEVAWIWRGDNYSPEGADPLLRATPIYAEGKLFSVAGSRRTAMAIDPTTGETLWTFREPETKRWRDSMRKNYGKGVAYDRIDGRGVIYLVTPAFFLHALDAETGEKVASFGDGGTVDLLANLGDYGPYDRNQGLPPEVGYITNSSPPIVANGVVVIGNSHEQGYYQSMRENVPGNILAYDARTGEHKWTFDVIPQEGEFGNDTWESDAWRYTGNVSAWAPLSADPELGMVYVVTDPPTIDYYGGFHPGDNLFSTTILALDLETGERRWHFQTVHHDIWNYDNPTAPNLVDITVDGRPIRALVQTTKQSWAYVLDRETGEPVWPIEERPVPQSDVPGEHTSPTQPFPTRPAPYEMQGITEDDLIDFTPELRAEALEIAANYRFGPIFNPPMVQGTDGKEASVHCPGANGGANIPGGAVVDPETGVLYVASTKGCSAPRLVPGTDVNPDSNVRWVSVGPGGVPGPDGLPLWKPPYGRITAIDLNTGEHLWWIPNGDTPDRIKEHEALEGVDIGNTGARSHATKLVTKTLLMYGEGRGAAPVFRAVDKATGMELGRVELPAPTLTAPMTFMHQGAQYVVMAVGGGGYAGSLVALRLPD